MQSTKLLNAAPGDKWSLSSCVVGVVYLVRSPCTGTQRRVPTGPPEAAESYAGAALAQLERPLYSGLSPPPQGSFGAPARQRQFACHGQVDAIGGQLA